MVDIFAMRELLKGEYRKTFEKIGLYGDMSNINHDIVEDRICNIYDLLMEAQNEGKPVEKIVGNNLEKFCKSYFRYDGVGSVLKDIFKRVLNVAVIMLVFSFIEYFLLSEELVPITEAKVSIEALFIGIFIGFVIAGYGRYVQKKKIFIESDVKLGWHIGVILVIFFVGIGGLTALLKDVSIQLSFLTLVLVTGLYIVCYILFVMIYRFVKYGSLRNPNKLSKEERAERDAANKEIEERSEAITTARDLSERYLKLKAKNQKKGKPEYTMADFIKLIKKEVSQGKTNKIFMIVLAVGATAFSTFQSYNSDGVKGALVMFIILGGIMTVVTVFMWKILTEVNASMKQVIETCEERDIGIDEYAKELSDLN